MTSKKSIAFVSGHFNILHPGHIRLLQFAKKNADRLIVAVESDRIAGKAAHIHEQFRLEGIQCNNWVDEAFLLDEPVTMAITRLKPDIVVKGKEYELRINPELEVLERYGGKLLFSSGQTIFSSADLIRKEFLNYDPSSIKLPDEYITRHNINHKKLCNLITNFTKLRVCVVGDLIIDEYITCEPLGMSQEDPTIVVTPLDTKKFIGGAGIVAAHAAGLGATVKFLSVTGEDMMRDFAFQELELMGVNSTLLVDNTRPTTLKQRFRSKGKSLLRVSHLHQRAISLDLQSQLLAQVEKTIPNTDLLVFSDFNYGCLPQALVERIIQMAKSNSVMLAADSQSSSQVGNISRFQEMDLLTPTEREARISMRNHEDGLVILAESLRQQSKANNILLKLGGEGLLIHANKKKSEDCINDRIKALNSSPKDVAGAGDSLLITSAMVLAIGGNIWEAACLGSIAAAIQVSRVGNTPLVINDLIQELT